MAPRFPHSVLLIFAKPPQPGRVKTRLLSLLSSRQAAEVHLACVQDTTGMASGVRQCSKWLLVPGSNREAKKLARQLGLGRGWHAGLQLGGDLGERLAFAFRWHFVQGAEKVVVVGTDTPWMGAGRIRQALALLEEADVVLGPTADGGYYLAGARRLIPQMFERIPWGGSRVLRKTLAALRKSRASCRLLPRDFDLDRPADLRRVARLLRRRKTRAPALRRWLEASDFKFEI